MTRKDLSTKDLELDKFDTDNNGDTIVRVKLSDPAFFLEVAKGNVPGHSLVHKFGRNNRIDIANAEDIANIGGTYNFLTTASTIDVVSTNVNDTSVGSGARTVTISGLDANYDELVETVPMNGTTIVTTTGSFLRINTMSVITAGTSGENEGDITAIDGSFTIAKIDAGINRTQMAVYTIPNGKTGYLYDFSGSILPELNAIGVKEGDISLFIREIDSVFQVRSDCALSTRGTSAAEFKLNPGPLRIPAKSDVKIRMIVRANRVSASSTMDILLVDN